MTQFKQLASQPQPVLRRQLGPARARAKAVFCFFCFFPQSAENSLSKGIVWRLKNSQHSFFWSSSFLKELGQQQFQPLSVETVWPQNQMEMQNSTRTQNKVLIRESKPLNRPQITPGELQTQAGCKLRSRRNAYVWTPGLVRKAMSDKGFRSAHQSRGPRESSLVPKWVTKMLTWNKQTARYFPSNGGIYAENCNSGSAPWRTRHMFPQGKGRHTPL